MKYTDFETSAQRHLESCYHILETLTNSNAAYKKQKVDRLVLNVYYLSGYVIECTFKFAFFKAIRYDKKKNIELTHTILGIDYDLKSHNLTQLAAYLPRVDLSLPQNIPMITQTIPNTNHRIMADIWNSEIRYSLDYARTTFSIDVTLVQAYVDDVVKPIFEKLTRR